MNVVEIAPIVKSIEVRRSASDAFRVFTEELTAWWPLATHSRARGAEGERSVKVTIEPRVGGRVYETLNTGEERDWGEVLAWAPGTKFAMRWQMGRPQEQGTEVEVTFDPVEVAVCRVTLRHAHWERLGEAGPELRHQYDNGWNYVFGECYTNLVTTG
jgi:hypothetical protein